MSEYVPLSFDMYSLSGRDLAYANKTNAYFGFARRATIARGIAAEPPATASNAVRVMERIARRKPMRGGAKQRQAEGEAARPNPYPCKN